MYRLSVPVLLRDAGRSGIFRLGDFIKTRRVCCNFSRTPQPRILILLRMLQVHMLLNKKVLKQPLQFIAGTYVGGINGQDANGNPTNDLFPMPQFVRLQAMGSERSCHIFSDNVNTSDHYSESCLPCHTVGYLSGANGIDQASDWDAFIESGLLHNTGPTNWTTILADYPQTAQLSNIQCENCHGPQSPAILKAANYA